MEEAVLELIIQTVAKVELVPLWPEELEADLDPVAGEGPHVAIVRGSGPSLLGNDVVQVEAVDSAATKVVAGSGGVLEMRLRPVPGASIASLMSCKLQLPLSSLKSFWS